MKPKSALKTIVGSVFVFCVFCSTSLYAQNTFESQLINKLDSISSSLVVEVELYPNDAPQGVSIPSGWGGFGTYVFGFVGASYPEVYHSNEVDLIASAGFCVGDPEKAINFAAGVNIENVSEFKSFSGNFAITRKIFRGSSISVGGLQLFTDPNSDAPRPSFFVAFSHSIQTMPSKTPGCSKLTYTIGIGNGRFVLKSPKDVEAGKGKYGTAVFAGISYELLQRVNINAEWTGLNLAMSLGVRPFKKLSLSFGIGVTDLTTYSSDKPSGTFFIGYPLSLNRKK